MSDPRDTLDGLEAFIILAMALDRNKISATAAILDSDLGKAIAGTLSKSSAKKATGIENGVAALKLTAFYLDELHKIFQDP
jgi:hypothetical protein